MSRVLGLLGIVAMSACAGVPPAAVREWGNDNFGHYRKLIDDKYSGDSSVGTRVNMYKSMASLVCTADTADKKQSTSVGCQCQLATSDADAKTACEAFINNYKE